MSEDENAIPVYAVVRSEFDPKTDKPIGAASTRGKAYRQIRAYLLGHEGTDYELKSSDIIYSSPLKAWFIDD